MNALTELPGRLDDETALEDVRFVSVHRTDLSAGMLSLRQAEVLECAFAGCRLPRLRLIDAVLGSTDLANANCERASGMRVVLKDCRLMGADLSGSDWDDLLVSHCHAPYARFPESTFRRAVFDTCNLEDADFFASDLTGVVFRNCNLKGCRFSECRCRGADFRGSDLEGAAIGPQELQGAIIEPMQAPILIARFGLTVKWAEE